LSLDSISTIENAEAEAAKLKSEALQKAKEILNRAESEGKLSVEQAKDRAREEILIYREKLGEATSRELELINDTSRSQKSAIRECAEAKLPEVSAMIKERIVNGK